MMADVADIEAIVFDIGGTLLDFEKPESRTQLHAGIRNGYEYLCSEGASLPTLTAYRRRIERRLLSAYLWSRIRRGELDPLREIRSVHTGLGVELDAAGLAEFARRLYEPTKAIAHAHPDSPAALATLRDRGYKLGIISNTIATPQGLDDHLACEGLLDFFPVRIYSCMIGVPKPNPRIFHAALDRLKVPAHRAVYVGDKPRIDVKGARRVGMVSVLRVPLGKPTPAGPRPDHLIREIADLLDLMPARTGS